VSPPLEEKADADDDREVACHLYESAEGFDPYAQLERAGESNEAGDAAEVPSDDD
jgi:peptide/nickel transport system ATP-binding protein